MNEIILCDYIAAADKYKPKKIKCLFIAESPPAYKSEERKAYFYFENMKGSDILFATLIYALYDIKYRKADLNKARLLHKFQDDGYWLMDVVEHPINRLNGTKTTPKEREGIINKEIPNFLARLTSLKEESFTPSTGVIILKKLNYEILRPVLLKHGVTVLNKNKIDFPKYYLDRDTVEGIRIARKIN